MRQGRSSAAKLPKQSDQSWSCDSMVAQIGSCTSCPNIVSSGKLERTSDVMLGGLNLIFTCRMLHAQILSACIVNSQENHMFSR